MPTKQSVLEELYYKAQKLDIERALGKPLTPLEADFLRDVIEVLEESIDTDQYIRGKP